MGKTTAPRYPQVHVSVTNGDSIPRVISRVSAELRRAGVSEDERRVFETEASEAGNASAVLDLCSKWVEVS